MRVANQLGTENRPERTREYSFIHIYETVLWASKLGFQDCIEYEGSRTSAQDFQCV